MSFSWFQRHDLVSRNLQEISDEARLKDLIQNGQEVTILWGTATTGRPHIAYFLPVRKLADFLNAGCRVVVLFADVHAFLDDPDLTEWSTVQHRVRYYEIVMKSLLRYYDAPLEKLQFIRGSDFQLSKPYTLDMLRLSKLVTERDAKKAGSEVVKTSNHPKVSGLLYPGLQALDEEYLNVDCHFGGLDQRKAFVFAEKYLPNLEKKKRIHLMSPMVQGLTGSKMSSSQETTKISFSDDVPTVERKLRKAFCEPGNVERNGVLSIVERIIFPLITGYFEVNETKTFSNFALLRKAFVDKKVHPKELKDAVCREINRILDPIRDELKTPELQELTRQAYS